MTDTIETNIDTICKTRETGEIETHMDSMFKNNIFFETYLINGSEI